MAALIAALVVAILADAVAANACKVALATLAAAVAMAAHDLGMAALKLLRSISGEAEHFNPLHPLKASLGERQPYAPWGSKMANGRDKCPPSRGKS